MPLVLKNVLRNPGRSLLTTVSVAVSFCMLGVLMSMYRMFFLAPPDPDQALRLIVRNRISFTNPLPLSYQNRIASVRGVSQVMKYQWFGGIYKDSREPRNMFARFAVDPPTLFKVYPEYKISADERQAFLRERQSCILGRPLAERLGVKVGDHITLAGDIFHATLDLVVRGFYDSKRYNEYLYFHYDYLNEALFPNGMNFVSMYAVTVDRPEDTGPVARNIDAVFRNATNQTKTETEKSLQLSFLAYIGNVKLFLLALCASLTLATLFVSANTMAMSVRERVPEIGILKTLGFTDDFIVKLFVGESLAVALAGGAAGLFVAELIIALLRHAPAIFVDLKALALPAGLLAASLGLAAVLGVLSSAFPALAASHRGILDCLRVTD